MPYYQHPIKCLNCGLHFIVCSDYEDWPDHGTTREQIIKEATGLIYCPECGQIGQRGFSGKMIQWLPRETEGFIFQAVPGEQPMTEQQEENNG